MVMVLTLTAQIMNKIGFGIFCFGDEFYFNGTLDKIKDILDNGYHCHILTDNVEFFNTKYSFLVITVINIVLLCFEYPPSILTNVTPR